MLKASCGFFRILLGSQGATVPGEPGEASRHGGVSVPRHWRRRGRDL